MTKAPRDPHRKPSPRLPLKPADFLLLAVLQDGPLHGYALGREMARRSAGEIKIRPGDLYRVLYRLAEQGIVEAIEDAEDGERRTRYRLSALGRRTLTAEAHRVARLSAEVLAAAGEAERSS
ncbi:MAG: PadR family transcriptional regulator [Acidobacteriota bacterium]